MLGDHAMRRLRKLSAASHEAQSGFHSSVQVFCVGAVVVYRVSLSVMAPRCGEISSGRRTWEVLVSEGSLGTFHNQVMSLLSHAAVTTKELSFHEDSSLCSLLESMKTIVGQFQHLRGAFDSNTHSGALHAAAIELSKRFGECWEALEVALALLAMTTHPSQIEFSVFALLCEFLATPDVVLSSYWSYISAVLSLQDADDEAGVNSQSRNCSICLDKIMHKNLIPSTEDNTDQNGEVVLSCKHYFHDHCITSWLWHSPTCPECRHSVNVPSIAPPK